jgi:uncharacterized protein
MKPLGSHQLITAANLKSFTRQELTELAKELGVPQWQRLGRDALIVAVEKARKSLPAKVAPSKATSSKSAPAKAPVAKKAATTNPASAKTINPKLTSSKPASVKPAAAKPAVTKPTKLDANKKGAAATGGSKLASVPAKSPSRSKRPTVANTAAEKRIDKKSIKAPAVATRNAPHHTNGASKVSQPKAVNAKLAPSKLPSPTKPPVTPAKPASSEKPPAAAKAVAAANKPVATTKTVPTQKPTATAKPVAVAKPPATKPAPAPSPPKPPAKRPPEKPQLIERSPTPRRVMAEIERLQADQEHRKDLSSVILVSGHSARGAGGARPAQDRIILLVRDPYWLHAQWEVTRHSIDRAKASMAEHWHTAKPIVRLFEVDSGASANASEMVVRDVVIHGGVNTWYLDVDYPGSRFRVAIGYLAATGKFYQLCRSNIIQTPQPGSCDVLEGHWRDIAQDYERIYAQSGGYDGESGSTELREVFESQLSRPVGGPQAAPSNAQNPSHLRRDRELPFQVDAELVVFGATDPSAYVTVAGEPVKLRADGTFTVRMDLPDKRQVLPVVASTRDGSRQRTTVVAVERNTKVMEPIVKDDEEE